ncbi:MAG: iron-containing redox enzyme family protein, partial [Panacagrimonas sp.]
MTRWHTVAVSQNKKLLKQDASAACPPVQMHRRLAAFNRKRLLPTCDEPRWPAALSEEMELRSLEVRFVRAERAAVASRLQGLPTDPAGFMEWFHALKEHGPGQGDPLFGWLAHAATLDQLRWFLRQEAAGEAGFDDLVALTQIRFPARPKLEMANNYWDEMGRGRESGMHGPMLERTTRALDLRPRVETTVWESLALANLMVAMAINRHLAYQSVGALGAIEMTAPGRVSQVNEGMRRLGLAADVRRYFQLHAGLDVRHSLAWNREVIEPLVAADPRAARAIAEGALLRLCAGARCFERYRAELW